MTPPMPWLAGRRALVAGRGEAARTVGEAINAAGADVVNCPILADGDEDIAAEFAAIEDRGAIEILVHGVELAEEGVAAQIGLNTWRGGVSASVDHCFLRSAEFARRCIATGRSGAILLLLPSTARLAGHAMQATVVGALDNLVKTLAVEWARDGIRVNAIASRACEAGGLSDPTVRASLGHLAAYLVSDYSAYVSGIVMGVDET